MRVARVGNLTCRTARCAASHGKLKYLSIEMANGALRYEPQMSKVTIAAAIR